MKKKQNLIRVKATNQTLLLYKPLPRVRADGVCATLAGYEKGGRKFWY